jgi:putative transposase
MPGRNTVRAYQNDCFYHVYNRGINKQPVFLEPTDYTVFLNLLKRYLSKIPESHPKNGSYPSFYYDVELLAFCLIPNHFHLLLYQVKDQGIANFLKSVSTSYGMYFNKKYGRVGPVFQGRFKASIVQKDAYLHHVSRYIHLNPTNYKTWDYSSYQYYCGNHSAEWLRTERVMELLDNDKEAYRTFVSDYEEQKALLDELKYELADW